MIIRPRVLALLLRVLLTTGLLTPGLLALAVAPPPVAALTDRATRQAETYAATAHAATNLARRRHGVTPVGQDRCLRRAAVRQATLMAETSVLAHQDLTPVLASCGMRSVGENVAAGFGNGPAVVAGWLASSGHRTNLLRPTYRLEGIGAVRDARGRWWVAQVFGTRVQAAPAGPWPAVRRPARTPGSPVAELDGPRSAFAPAPRPRTHRTPLAAASDQQARPSP